MPSHVFLLRHADTAKDPSISRDQDRPLTQEGKADAMRMGRWLRQQGIRPARVVSSPAARAGQTARLVCEELGLGEDRIEWVDEVYEAAPADLLRIVQAHSGDGGLLLVGHNPGMEGVVEGLCGAVPPGVDGKVMPSGSLARVRVPDGDDVAGRCRLEGITRPADIPA